MTQCNKKLNHAGGEWFKAVYGSSFMYEIRWMRWKKFSPLKTAKIHRIQR